jgi:hypothetical protein
MKNENEGESVGKFYIFNFQLLFYGKSNEKTVGWKHGTVDALLIQSIL